ncbi:Hypothetical predicted protein [Paramuricea clavata]|uniref:Uncharacterized protein n=1 Tax=Paramuricea clavata TaxID=317549 RepID=A0A7D9E5M6_PARCT|nr:Hypothetical predicted protein [Paramuricea clavata]
MEAEQVHNVNTERPGKRYFANLSMSETGLKFKNVKFQIDTAATCNTISEATLKTFLPDTKIQKYCHLPYPYGNSKPLHPIGQVELLCERERKFETLTFQVLPPSVMQNKPGLLSGTDSERLGLITIKADEIFTLSTAVKSKMGNPGNLPSFKLFPAQERYSDFTATGPKQQVAADDSNSLTCNHQEQTHNNCPKLCTPPPTPSKPIKIPAVRKLPPPGQLKEEHILQEYAETFSGLGCLGPPVHFTTKDNMSPIQMPVHRVPVAKREKEKVALDRYEQEGIIKKVEEPTPWCSNELIKETPKKFRICIDPSQTINKAILRPIYQMPTLNEQLHKLCNAKCFTMLDVRDGFLHVPLDEESSHMTTMHTTYGRYRWLRLPFGITSAPEEFQKRLIIALEGLEGVICIADDILVFGEGDDYKQAEKDHDRRLIALMERCIQQNIKLNAGKLQFKLKEVKFMGNIITSEGMKADPGKVSGIIQMPTPRNKAAVLRFIGMVNYLSPFCEHLSATIQPLRNLTQNGVPFNWSQAQDDAFTKAKELISKSPTLAYYNLSKPVVIQADASDEGLGGALLQPDEQGRLKPVAFTSCSMSSTEQRYSQIEKECLAICHSFNKFDQWLYGKKDIEVHTDHQPLETILRKPLNKAPARLQKMMMKLQRYSFKVTYKKGKSMYLADTLSRAALPDPV